MKFIDQVNQYVREDIDQGIKKLNLSDNFTARLVDVSWKSLDADEVHALATIEINDVEFDVHLGYYKVGNDVEFTLFDADGIETDFDIADMDKYLIHEYERAAHNKHFEPITAADDETVEESSEDLTEDSDFATEEEDTGSVETNDTEGITDVLDDVSNTLDDLQDTVEDIEPDLIDIQMNNNIENHYIAECDACHGVFISAVVKSDVEISHVHGKCPICDREANQQLNWLIVRSTSSNV